MVKRMRQRKRTEGIQTGAAGDGPGRPCCLHRKKSRPPENGSLPCIIFALRGFQRLTATAFRICGGSLVYSFSAPLHNDKSHFFEG